MSAQAYPVALQARRARGGADVRGPLRIAALCVLGGALVWVLQALVPATHVRDAVALHDFTLLSHPRVDDVARFLLHLLDPQLFVLWSIALVATALARNRARVAVAIVAILTLAPLSADILKPLLAHPHAYVDAVGLGSASWPSGHAAAAMALALSAVLAAPARWRSRVALAGGAYVLGVGVSLLILAWHMPSDVVGGVLLATFWAALALALLRYSQRRWPATRASPMRDRRAPTGAPQRPRRPPSWRRG